MWDAHIRSQRDRAPRFALLHATVQSRMAYEAREGGAATSRCQAGASQRNKQDCPGRTSSTCHPLTTCLRGGTEVPSTCGTGWRAARAQNGLPSIAGLCKDPTDMRLFPARLPGTGQRVWRGRGALQQHRGLPLPPGPGLSSLLCRGGADGRHCTASPRTASKAQGRFKALKASRGWLRNAGQGRGDTGTHRELGLRFCRAAAERCATAWRAREGHACARHRHPGAKAAPALAREPAAQADPPLQLDTPLAQPLCSRRGAETSSRKTGCPAPSLKPRVRCEPRGRTGRRAPVTTALMPAT